jgi:NADH-quinone oxidoreductase subunit K
MLPSLSLPMAALASVQMPEPDYVIPTEQLMILAAALFALGMLGFLIRRNLIVVFMSIELMINAANLTFLAGARHGGFDANGQVYALLVIVLAAVEAAIGLAILIAFFRLKASLDADKASALAG